MPRPRKAPPVEPVAPEPVPPKPEGVVRLKVLRPVPNPRLVSCMHPDGRYVLLQVRDSRNYWPPLEVDATRADDRPDLYAVVGERAGRDPRSKGRWKLGRKK